MAYQLSDLVSRVQRRLRDTSYSTTEIGDYLNDTMFDICNEYRLPFMLTTKLYTLAPSNSDITVGVGLPADYSQTVDMIDTTNGEERVLPYRDIRQIDGLFPDSDDTTTHPAGQPQYWYFYGETPHVYPVPDKAYTFELRYYKKPTELLNDTDVPAIPIEWRELLVVGAVYRIMEVKDDYDSANVFENKYQELLTKLIVKSNQQQVGRPTQMRINREHVVHVTSWKGR